MRREGGEGGRGVAHAEGRAEGLEEGEVQRPNLARERELGRGRRREAQRRPHPGQHVGRAGERGVGQAQHQARLAGAGEEVAPVDEIAHLAARARGRVGERYRPRHAAAGAEHRLDRAQRGAARPIVVEQDQIAEGQPLELLAEGRGAGP
ncbi:MAG TPA: hypothetical protein VFS00_28030, partial [Polyangiaceae bacterium]|nr:hypothetical protein [Polyangiaceae bacterium]